MGVEELVETLMEFWVDVREYSDTNCVMIDEYVLCREDLDDSVYFRFILYKDNDVVAWVETDGSVYYNVYGNLEWEEFLGRYL